MSCTRWSPDPAKLASWPSQACAILGAALTTSATALGIGLERTEAMMARRRFHDREDAGRELAKRLERFRKQSPIVLGLPRGGVPIAYEVARALHAPLDVWVARKLGAPIQPELGMGAVAEGGEIFVDAHVVREVGASEAEVQEVIARKTAEVEDRCKRLRHGRAAPDLTDKSVLLVDDGIATGGTARAALRAIRRHRPRTVVLAVPVGSTDALKALASEADEIVCLSPQRELYAVGHWYEDFRPVEDDDVVAILDEVHGRSEARMEEPVERSIGEGAGDLFLPARARGERPRVK